LVTKADDRKSNDMTIHDCCTRSHGMAAHGPASPVAAGAFANHVMPAGGAVFAAPRAMAVGKPGGAPGPAPIRPGFRGKPGLSPAQSASGGKGTGQRKKGGGADTAAIRNRISKDRFEIEIRDRAAARALRRRQDRQRKEVAAMM
jgi:hypothetical protein